ncbi:guanine nucleotide-binding protein G(s) subunit alpha-like protein, partial [Dinothrombium tinctorium]
LSSMFIGAAESGKTTIIKQMKILHVQGFSDEERKEKVDEIRTNLLEAIKEIIENLEHLKLCSALTSEQSQASLDYLNSIDLRLSDYQFSDEFYYHTKNLWNDEIVQKSYQQSITFHIMDSAKYFLDRIDEISQEDYIPTDNDILRCRKRTSEIQKVEFDVKVPLKYGGGVQSFWMFDVGGQKGERRKWIQVFDGITAVLFLVACSTFDTVLREDKTNRLQEALTLFEEVWCSRFLRDSGFILFFNKQDILREKIDKGIDLSVYFPDYKTYDTSENRRDSLYEYKKARAFIRDKFLAITKKVPEHRKYSTDYIYYENVEESKKKECFWHYTTATDTDNIKRVFQDVHTMILVMNISKISLT